MKDPADKTLAEMSFSEKLNWASGHLIMGIGEGKFRERLGYILMAVTQEAYDRGLRDGKAGHGGIPGGVDNLRQNVANVPGGVDF